MNDIQVIPSESKALGLVDEKAELEELDSLFTDRKAKNTNRTYDAAWRQFQAWCNQRQRESLPADIETIALFLNWLGKSHSLSTVRTYRAALVAIHRDEGLADPTDSKEIKGILKALARRKKNAGERQHQAKGATQDDTLTILNALGDSPKELRAKALLAVARAALARRSELVALTFANYDQIDCMVSLYRQKTGQWSDVALTPGACEALVNWTDWLASNGIDSGALFRSLDRHGGVGESLDPSSVPRIFKWAYSQAGLDPSGISGHSARVGSAQDLIAQGADVAAVAVAGGWTGTAMPVRYGSKVQAQRGAVATMLEV